MMIILVNLYEDTLTYNFLIINKFFNLLQIVDRFIKNRYEKCLYLLPIQLHFPFIIYSLNEKYLYNLSNIWVDTFVYNLILGI